MVVIMKGVSHATRGRDTIHRWEDNPLIDISDLEFKCSDIHNAGVVSFEGKTIMGTSGSSWILYTSAVESFLAG